MVYADDLNGFKAFPRHVSSEEVLKEVEHCKEELHTWGKAKNVTFDTAKESAHMFCKNAPGEDMVILGVAFDTKLTMETTVRQCGRPGGD